MRQRARATNKKWPRMKLLFIIGQVCVKELKSSESIYAGIKLGEKRALLVRLGCKVRVNISLFGIVFKSRSFLNST